MITRISEYVPDVVEFIQGIMANGAAYESNGSVYFDTEAFKKSGIATASSSPPRPMQRRTRAMRP